MFFKTSVLIQAILTKVIYPGVCVFPFVGVYLMHVCFVRDAAARM